MKIELGKKPTQKVPKSEDSMEEEMRIVFKNETGNTATYKRNGEWKESKKYKEWKNIQLSKLDEEVNTDITPTLKIDANVLAKKNLIKIMGMTDGIEKYKKQLGKKKKSKDPLDDYEVGICMTCEKRKMIDPGTGSCESCNKEMSEQSREKKKDNEDIPLYDETMQRRCLFLWNLMSEKMDFTETPTSEEIKQIEEIHESVKYWLKEEE